MSECVVRMERVPKNCDDGCWGSLSGECPWCDSIDGYKMVGNRPPNCPIIAVLPEGHGRLVDEQELFARCRPVKNFDNLDSLVIVKGAVIQSQTIVPAERSET